ncbi:solute carrier family 49 member 4-like [Lethenteron reissneri]|uniref:solute carrier family 49 member 4-like n=1 Tax=Lethenteron reissneri TaxID=7753 RepID=UPI002AB723C1|nr:solute carrier family 49 member 4-like [Lethenteron reissneri]
MMSRYEEEEEADERERLLSSPRRGWTRTLWADETGPGVGVSPGPRARSPCRWLVLATLAAFAFMQGLARNAWLPVQDTAQAAGLFNDTDVALLANWGALGFSAFPFLAALLDKRGLRVSLLASLFLLTTGCGLRCIPTDMNDVRRWLIHSGQLVIGMAGPVALAAGPYLSTAWFPQDERTTGTAVGVLTSYLGGACAFLLEPLLVHMGSAPHPHGIDGQMRPPTLGTPSEALHRIQLLLYAELVVVMALFLVVVLYFPAHPPVPPSISSATPRLGYCEAICRLLTRPWSWVAILLYAVPLAVSIAWLKQLNYFLPHDKVSTTDAGWASLAAVVAGCAGSLVVARFADYFTGQLKVIVLTLLAGASIVSVWFTLSCLGLVPFLHFYKGNLLGTCVLFGACLVSAVPLLLELVVEATFPVPEGLSCGLAAFISVVAVGVPLNVLISHFAEVTWLSWCLAGSCACGVLGILLLPETYNRLHLDVFLSV